MLTQLYAQCGSLNILYGTSDGAFLDKNVTVSLERAVGFEIGIRR